MSRLIIILVSLIAFEFFAFRAFSALIATIPNLNSRVLAKWLYWILTLGVFIGTPIMFVLRRSLENPSFEKFGYTLFGVLVLITVPKIVLVLSMIPEWTLQTISWMKGDGFQIERRLFISKIGSYVAIASGIGILYGMLKGRYQYTVHTVKVPIRNLPAAFEGFTIAQISDLHLGSYFGDTEGVTDGFSKLLELKPDMIVFTGDMVNNIASETTGFDSVLKSLKAPYGVFSILGNHDYGDYYEFASKAEKTANLDSLIAFQRACGFDLLLNESRKIEKDGATLEIIGVENWGKPPFVQYGDLQKALENTNPENPQILLSHDPSHWTEQVLSQSNIDLQLAGHTHGMQFGIEIPGFKWSPVKWKYPQWAGLYSEDSRHLYVNRGFGFIGFPGRVGIWPEITYIQLTNQA